jgi:DNA-binding MarR family transcriptional regulator
VADLDALEERGLLVRRVGADRRANELVATDAGTATMRAVQAAIHRAEDALLAPLSSADRKVLHRLLPQLAAAARSPKAT